MRLAFVSILNVLVVNQYVSLMIMVIHDLVLTFILSIKMVVTLSQSTTISEYYLITFNR